MLLIVGAGGLGREVWQWARAQEGSNPGWTIGGFLDANPHALQGFAESLPILGDPASFEPLPHHCFATAIGESETRLRLCEGLVERGAEFVSIIHPSAVVCPDARMGRGCVICPGAIVSTAAALGDFVVLNMNCSVGHDAVLGDGSTLACHADVTGAAVLGRGAMVGSHGSVLPGLRVGDFAVVAAGSVAYRDVPARSTVIGVPARVLRRPDDETS